MADLLFLFLSSWSALTSHWSLASLFTNQNQLGAGPSLSMRRLSWKQSGRPQLTLSSIRPNLLHMCAYGPIEEQPALSPLSYLSSSGFFCVNVCWLGMCPDVHVILRGCYRQGAIVTMKHCHGRQVEEERVISSSRAVMTGAQVRLEPEAGAHWEAMEGWVLLTGSLPMVFSACFIIKPRTTSPGMEPPAMGWGLGPPPSITN